MSLSKRQVRMLDNVRVVARHKMNEYAEQIDSLREVLSHLERKYLEWRRIECNAVNMRNGVMEFDRSKLDPSCERKVGRDISKEGGAE